MSVKKYNFIKRFLPQTLFGRSLLILVLPILLIQVVSTFIFFDRHWSKMTSRLAFAVSGEVAVIVSYFESDSSDQEIAKITDISEAKLGFLITYDRNATLDIVDGKPKNILGVWNNMIKNTLVQELKGSINYPFYINVGVNEKWVEIRIEMDDGVLNISLPQRRLFSSTTYIFLFWFFGTSIIFLVISVLFMRNQIRPIRRLAIAAERFGKGGNVSNFKIEGAKEVRQAGRAFIEMKARLQRQISQRTDMLAGVSHDLRTPLTRLKLQIAMMGDGEDISDMKNDIHDMEKMIEGYLNFVRGEGQEKAVITDFPKMLMDIVDTGNRQQGSNITLETNSISIFVRIRASAFKRCINNIVDNARKYADNIWITLEKSNDNEIKIIIEDDGIGIDENKFDDVFKPFYRVDSSRNVSDGSVGLGLPIAMDIVHSHGGNIWLEKSKYGGLSVNITLPI